MPRKRRTVYITQDTDGNNIHGVYGAAAHALDRAVEDAKAIGFVPAFSDKQPGRSPASRKREIRRLIVGGVGHVYDVSESDCPVIVYAVTKSTVY